MTVPNPPESKRSEDLPRSPLIAAHLPFLLLAIAAPVATLGLPHLPRILLGPNMFLSALPLANEIASIHFLQLVCVGLMVCAGISLTRGIGGGMASASRILLWSCAIATSVRDPILSVATNSVIRHWQGLSASPEVILDAVGNLPADTLIRLAHPMGPVAQIAWCMGIGATALVWRQAGGSWQSSLGLLSAMLFAGPYEPARYVGLLGFITFAIVIERERLNGTPDGWGNT